MNVLACTEELTDSLLNIPRTAIIGKKRIEKAPVLSPSPLMQQLQRKQTDHGGKILRNKQQTLRRKREKANIACDFAGSTAGRSTVR